jgi:hypothetical protein
MPAGEISSSRRRPLSVLKVRNLPEVADAINLWAFRDSGLVYLLRDSQVLPAGMLIASVEGRRLGDALRFGRAFCLRLVFAIQLEIWPIESPVSCFKTSFSSSVG